MANSELGVRDHRTREEQPVETVPSWVVDKYKRWSAAAFWSIVVVGIASAYLPATRWIGEAFFKSSVYFISGTIAYFFALGSKASLPRRLLYSNAIAVFVGAAFFLSGQDRIPTPTHAHLCEVGVDAFSQVLVGMSGGSFLAWLLIHPSRNEARVDVPSA